MFVRGENIVFVHDKFYRRSFLNEHHIRFDTAMEFNEDSVFNSVLSAMTDCKRIGAINTLSPIYVWTYRDNSATSNPANRQKSLVSLFERNKRVCEAYRLHRPYEDYCAMIARTVFDAYYTLNIQKLTEE